LGLPMDATEFSIQNCYLDIIRMATTTRRVRPTVMVDQCCNSSMR
jgi:hypothetical protein